MRLYVYLDLSGDFRRADESPLTAFAERRSACAKLTPSSVGQVRPQPVHGSTGSTRRTDLELLSSIQSAQPTRRSARIPHGALMMSIALTALLHFRKYKCRIALKGNYSAPIETSRRHPAKSNTLPLAVCGLDVPRAVGDALSSLARPSAAASPSLRVPSPAGPGPRGRQTRRHHHRRNLLVVRSAWSVPSNRATSKSLYECKGARRAPGSALSC